MPSRDRAVSSRSRVSWRAELRRNFDDAIRQVRRAPGFCAVVVVTLAVGLAATTAVFSLVDGLLLRPLPVRDPERLATIASRTEISQGRLAGGGWSYAMWERLRARGREFDGVLAWRPARLNVAERGEAQFVEGIVTSSDFFRTLGVSAAVGRVFTTDDDRRGGGPEGPVAVLSDAFWQRQFAGAEGTVGRSLVIEGVPFTIAGITPPGFGGVEVGRPFDLAVTFGAEPLIRRGASIDMPNAFGLIPMVRLRPGHSLSQATDVLRRLQAEIVGPASRVPPSLAQPFVLVPASSGTSAAGAGMSGLRQQYGQPLLVLLTIAAALLASACITVATLLLIRGSGRARELSVRLALGASRARLATQLLAESQFLGLIAAAAAVPLAHWMTQAVSHQISAIDPSAALNGSLGWRAGVPITIAAIGVVLCTGLVPALFTVRGARTNPAAPHAQGPQASQPRLVNALVVAQVAVCLVLLVAAGLLVRTVVSLTSVPLGFDPKAVLLVSADTSRVPLGDGSRLAIYQRMIASVNGGSRRGERRRFQLDPAQRWIRAAPGEPASRTRCTGDDAVQFRLSGLVRHLRHGVGRRARFRHAGHRDRNAGRRHQRDAGTASVR